MAAMQTRYPDDAEQKRALARLERYVRIETPTGDAVAILSLIALLAEQYASLGAETTLHPVAGGAHLVVNLPGRGRGEGQAPVLLVGHADTVWPRGTLASEPAWSNDGARITGPGAFDMKSGLVVIEEALILTAAADDRRPVRIIVTADEEIGSPSSRELLIREAEGCAAAIGFESPHPDGGLKVGRLGSTRLRLFVTGVGAHAALDPDSGVSAAEELIDQLVLVRAIVESVRAETGQQVLYNLGSIDAPGLTNVVSSRAEALLGFRFSQAESEARVLAGIDSLVPIRAGASIAFERLSYRPTWTARPADVALARSLSEAAGGLPGHAPAAGAADTNFLGRLDLAVVDGMGPRGGGAHARSEHLLIADLWQRIVLLSRFLCDSRAGQQDVAPTEE